MKPADPLITLFVTDDKPGEEEAAGVEVVEEEDKRVFCSRCGEAVSHIREQISVQGSFEHTFTNAYGYVYRIGCFKNASGCIPAGLPTDEFTWFSGFMWRYALCLGCRTHLGWYYSSEEDSFYGLIMDYLLFGRGS